MTPLAQWITLCQAADAIAWEELCSIVETAGRHRIQRLLRLNGFDPSRYEEILQELYEQMHSERCRRLSRFRGTTMQELRAFMGVVAYRFAKRRVAQWVRSREKEKRALDRIALAIRGGPSEHEVAIARRELELIMPAADRDKLQRLSQHQGAPCSGSGASSPASSEIPERTIRHWQLELFRKYGDRI